MTVESARLMESTHGLAPWKKWGPYLSERQWGTVREDYSDTGSAWDYFSHDQARSRAYRWGEDGIAGISDDKQILCFALAMWNGVDPILKERLFGLTNAEGNHGEDCKEYYFYLDSTPTHSYMKFLYKYPQMGYPYAQLVLTNQKRTRTQPEFELIDTGIFDNDHYFDIVVEYAKAGPEDLLIRITAINRGDEAAPIDLLPTLWFRNTWSWDNSTPKPQILRMDGSAPGIRASHPDLGNFYLYADGDVPFLFTENETNQERIFHSPNASPYVKDGIDNFIVNGAMGAVNPAQQGTKAAAHLHAVVPPYQQTVFCLRLRREAATAPHPFGPGFDSAFVLRIREANEFYDSVTPRLLSADQRLVFRQALAGMLWTKQYYFFDLDKWLREHGYDPIFPGRCRPMRNMQWFHMVNDRVISMPDKWEYPWYAAWDLAFHAIALGIVDLDFAKDQLDTMLREAYLHPNGQIPAYEWNFGDVNPPVHAWATLYLYNIEKSQRGVGDVGFLKSSFNKLLLNFAWWLNRKDRFGRNLFEGGFLGLDNVGVFDRSAPLPAGGYLEQADGTAWMALYSQVMLSIAMELADDDPSYDRMVVKFLDHFLWIAGSMDRAGDHEDELWDEEDGFFYDLLCLPDGSGKRLKVRSMVGLIPLCAVSILPPKFLDRHPVLMERVHDFFKRRPEIAANLHRPDVPGVAGRHMLCILSEHQLRRVLARMLDEDRFFSPYGIRSLSKWHQTNPYELSIDGSNYRVAYEPAESESGLFGGNSNWRGPVWFPVNLLIIRGLLLLYQYYGNRFTIECPTGSGRMMNLFEVAAEISNRMTKIFLRDKKGNRPVYGGTEKFQTDPHWRDCILFYEYFHGDNGAGIGASHQTGWTGLVAKFLEFFSTVTAEEMLREGSSAAYQPIDSVGAVAVSGSPASSFTNERP